MVNYLVDGLRSGPTLIRGALERLSGAERQPTGPGRFSPQEVLAHLADWEPIFFARMVQSQTPGAVFQVFDEGDRAREHAYDTIEWGQSLERYAQARAETVAWLSGLEREGWLAAGEHAERGRLTVYDQAVTLLGHDVYHVLQLETAAAQP